MGKHRRLHSDQGIGRALSHHATADSASIAIRAARLIAEGTSDFELAKKKAAKQLGLRAHCELPDNIDIESALREHYALYERETQAITLAALRRVAIAALDWLEHFAPWLSGPVLTGTANEFSQIDIELIGIAPKEFEFFLLNQNVEFTLSAGENTATPRPSRSVARTLCSAQYQFEFEGVPLRVTLYPSHSLRLAAHPRGSRFHARAKRDAAINTFTTETQLDPSSM